MAFIEAPRFPINISYGSTGGPRFQTDVVTFGNGAEYRNSRWSSSLARFDVRYDVRTRADALNVYEFFMARKGRFEGFRVKDLFDFTSNQDGATAPSATDQQIANTVPTTFDYQLIKTYEKGGQTTSRNILKPVIGTVTVELGGNPQVEGVDYTIDYTTGIVTFLSAPTGLMTAGYQFDIPCRFDTDDLSDLEFILKSANLETDRLSYPSIPLVEIRN